jgi:hypothetical protein
MAAGQGLILRRLLRYNRICSSPRRRQGKPMTFLKTTLAAVVVLLATLSTAPAAEPQSAQLSFRVAAQDPADGATLAPGERLFLRIDYDSAVPVRFWAEAYRQEVLQETTAIKRTPPYDAGHGEALVWVAFDEPIRITAVRVTAFDLAWQELGSQILDMTVTWEGAPSSQPRQPADWVRPLQKHHRQVFDTALDPLPEKPNLFYDVFLVVALISVPCYLLLQIRMLRRYRGSWRRYAAAPLFPLVPMALYSLIGLGLETNHWVIFLTYYTPVALLYLGILWLVKRYVDKPGHAAGTP